MYRSFAILLSLVPATAAAQGLPEGFSPPRLLEAPSAVYPQVDLQNRIEGDVELDLLLDEAGQVSEVTVTSSPSASLAKAAVEAAQKFRFAPAREQGEPVPCIIHYRTKFRLPPRPAWALTSSATAPANTATRSDSGYDVLVRGQSLPRAASDWTFELGVTRTAPKAGGSGAELMKKAPGFYISQHSGEGKAHQIFVRGFDAIHGQDTEITVSGLPVNEVSNIHAQGYADLHFVIPEVVRSLHIQEGTYDPRQGDFAVAGSLDFDLGLTERGVLVRGTAGQYGLLRTLIAWGPEGEPEETFVAAELAKGDGFGPARAWNRASVLGQVLFPLSSQLAIRILATSYAGRFDSAGVVREADVDAGRIDFYGSYDPNQGGASTRHAALLEARYRDGAVAAGLSAYGMLRGLRLRQNFTGYLLSPEGDRSEQLHDAFTVGGQGHYQKKLFDKRLSLEVGALWRHDQIDQSQRRLRTIDGAPQAQDEAGAGALKDDVSAELGVTELGLYGEAKLRAGDFTLRGGLRGEAQAIRIFDRLANLGLGDRREAFGYQVAPKLSLEWRVVPGLSLFGSYGKGFRSPQALSLQQGERSTFTSVHSGELGARILPVEGLILSAAAFATYVDADLVFDPTTGRTQLFGPTRRLGGALVLEAQPFEGFSATGSATYSHGVHADTGDQIPFVPQLVLRGDLRYQRPLTELYGLPVSVFGDLGLSFLGPRPLPFQELGESVFLTELGLGLGVGPVDVSLEIDNLLGSRWKDGQFVFASNFDPGAAASLVPAQHYTAGRPFTAQGTITVHY